MGFWKAAKFAICTAPLLLLNHGSDAITIDVQDRSTLQNAAEIAKQNAMVYYVGNEPGQIPGLLTNGYYWWECGALMSGLIQHWSITGNASLNNIITQALQWQVGDGRDYEPKNWSIQLGNDDQVFWAFAVLDAAEQGFPDPPKETGLSWLGLAQAVFNRQAAVWDTAICGGGLRWQIPPVNPGYDYKNTPSNGGLFQLASRLARYTGNQTYELWAEKTLDWMLNTVLIKQQTDSWIIYDGAHVEDNCSTVVDLQWTYNTGMLLAGSAYMYNHTNGSTIWATRLNNIINSAKIFFVQSEGANNPPELRLKQGGNILTEIACESPTPQTCNKDEPAFKGFLARWMAVTMQLAPFSADTFLPLLQGSAMAAAQQCTGQAQGMRLGTVCGRRWYQTTWDLNYGVGEQMSAMSIFHSLMLGTVPPPRTAAKGGTSKSQPSAGTGSHNVNPYVPPVYTNPVTTGDMAGAGILTVLSTGLITAFSWYMVK